MHPPTKAGVPVPIDGVPGFVHSRVHNDQSPQQATRAVDLLCDALETCAEGPQATYPELVELVDRYRLSIYDVLKRRYKGPPYY